MDSKHRTVTHKMHRTEGDMKVREDYPINCKCAALIASTTNFLIADDEEPYASMYSQGTQSMNRFKPLRYFEEDLTQKELRTTTTRAMNLKFTEHVYGHKLDNHEKHKMIMEIILDKKAKKFSKTKRMQRLQKKKIAKQRKKYEQDNKRKMLEVKWKTKLCQLSQDLRKQKIQKNHWRIGDFTKGARKTHGHGYRRRLLRRRIYTPNTESRLRQRLKTFNKTNEYGLTKGQLKKLEEEQKQREEEIQIEKKRTEDGKLLVTKKKVLKRYKHTQPDEESESESEGQFEAEEEHIEEAEELPEDINVVEVSEVSEKESENNVSETPIQFRRYKPLYPQFDENDGVEDLELPADVEEQIIESHQQNEHKEESSLNSKDYGVDKAEDGTESHHTNGDEAQIEQYSNTPESKEQSQNQEETNNNISQPGEKEHTQPENSEKEGQAQEVYPEDKVILEETQAQVQTQSQVPQVVKSDPNAQNTEQQNVTHDDGDDDF